MFKYRDHASISQTINKFTTFFGKKALPCFKQLSLNLYLILESIPLFQKDNNPLDFHAQIVSVKPRNIVRILQIG